MDPEVEKAAPNQTGDHASRRESYSSNNSLLEETMDDLSLAGNNLLNGAEDMIFDLFKSPETDELSVSKFLNVLKGYGLRISDPRLQDTLGKFTLHHSDKACSMLQSLSPDFDLGNLVVNRQTFKKCVMESLLLVVKALQNQLVIPDWPRFCSYIEEIYKNCKLLDGGKVASYIPQLSRVDPQKWGVSICTVDGQRVSFGNCNDPFSIQSVSKAFSYALALNDLGADVVHRYVGQEPSGRISDEICLDHDNRPHNPLINAGGLLVSSMIKNTWKIADRFDYVMTMFKKMSGNEYVGFNNPVFLSERETSDRNHALFYYLREHKCFPENLNLDPTLDFYFQLCSIEITCESGAVMAATLANGGVCPITGEKTLSNRSCRDTLSLMYSCGMYDYSGQFAFNVGLPAKCGYSGVMILIVPNVMGICLYSPALSKMNTPLRGVKFAEEFVDKFNFHNYDSLLFAESQKIDPRKHISEMHGEQIVNLLFSAKAGDMSALKRCLMLGMNLDLPDYDGRTALHVAACEGHLHVIRFLLEHGKVNHLSTDRWGRTALDDANHFQQTACAKYLQNWELKKREQKKSTTVEKVQAYVDTD